jgi:hypothetical protein
MAKKTNGRHPAAKTTHTNGKAQAALVNATADDPVALGRKAWERRKADTHVSWEDWKLIGAALLVGRQEAMKKAHKNEPSGRKYNELFSHWLQLHGFDDINQTDRSQLMRMMDQLKEVEAYRAGLSEAKRTTLNSPSAIWRAWQCPNRGNGGRGKNGAGEPPKPQTDFEKADAEFAAEEKDKDWHRQLSIRLRKAQGELDLRGPWALAEPPDDGLISVVDGFIEQVTGLRDYLDSIRNATPEELRADYLKAKHKNKRQPTVTPKAAEVPHNVSAEVTQTVAPKAAKAGEAAA